LSRNEKLRNAERRGGEVMSRIAVDFDGVCVVALPESGKPIEADTGAAEVLGDLVKAGHSLILWTCRNDDPGNPYNWVDGKLREETSLGEAVRWFQEHGIPLEGINGWEGEDRLIGKSRKSLFDYLIDDTSVGTKYKVGEVEYVSYETGEIKRTRTFCIDWEWMRSELQNLGLL